MARIKIYDNDPTITGGDKVLGTDEVTGGTKNFTVDALGQHILADGQFAGVVPQDRYITNGDDNLPKQGLIYESTTAETDVDIPANYVFRLLPSDTGFIVELDRYGLESTLFPYDIKSFIGKSWVSDSYPTAGEQVITAFDDPAFLPQSTATNQSWRFITTIANPLTTDLDSSFAGRALTNVVIDSLDRKAVVVAGDVNVLGMGTIAADISILDDGTGEYVSGATASGGVITLERAALPDPPTRVANADSADSATVATTVAVIDRATGLTSNLQIEIIDNDGTPSGAGFLTIRRQLP